MGKIRMIIAHKDSEIQNKIKGLTDDENFEVIDIIEKETEVIEKIQNQKPDIVFLGDDFDNLKVLDVLERVNKSYLEAITAFVVISNKEIPLRMNIYAKYKVFGILYAPLKDSDIKEKLSKIPEDILNYAKDVIRMSETNLEKQLYDYKYKRHLDYSKYLNEEDVELLKKLGVYIDFTELYTEEENEIFAMEINQYWDGAEDINGNLLPPMSDLEKTGVSREDYNRLNEILNSVETLYT